MNKDLGGSLGGSSAASGETASITFDIGQLWYLHEVAAEQHMADCEHGQIAVETTLLLEEAIVCCEDNGEEEAAIQLRMPEIVLLLGIVHRADKDSAGRPVGLEVARRLIRARLQLQLGRLPTTPDGDRTYADTLHDGGDA